MDFDLAVIKGEKLLEKKLLDYWIVLYRRRITIGLVVLGSMLTAFLLSTFLTPVYEARAVFYVPSSSPAVTYISGNSTSGLSRDKLIPLATEDDAKPYIGILKSSRIAEYVHNEFPRKKVMKLLLSDMDFELTDEYLIKIYSRDSDPVLAADVANAYLKYFNAILQDASSKNPEQDKKLLDEQLAVAEKNLAEAENALRSFSEQNNITSVDEEVKSLTDQRISSQAALDNSTVLIRENEEKIRASVEQLKKEGEIMAENDFALSSPTLDYMRNKLSDLTAQIGGQSAELTESHPDIKILKSQYKDMADKLEKEVQNLVKSKIKPKGIFYEELRQSLANLIIENNKLKATLKGNSKVLEMINDRMRKLPAINAEWSRLSDNVGQFKKIREQIRINLMETTMQQARPIQYAVVVDFAKPPKTPAFPLPIINILASLIFGLVAGVFYAFLMDYIESTSRVRIFRIIKSILSVDEK